MKQKAKGKEGSSTTREEDDEKLLKKIQKLDIKKKVQHFIWKACHDRIPIGVKLKERRIITDNRCRYCGEEAETLEHLFFHCNKVKLFWKLTPVSCEVLRVHTGSFKEWQKEQGKAGNHKEIKSRQEFSAYIFWHTWKARNAWSFNAELKTEKEVVQRAWEEWMEFNEAQEKEQKEQKMRIRMVEKKSQEPPEMRIVKLNVYFSGDEKNRQVKLGILARDCNGKTVQAWPATRVKINNQWYVRLTQLGQHFC